MTPKQTRIYWAAWGAVRKADPTADRHELHRRAFNGKDKSSKDFNTTTDLDAVLAVFRAISDPSNLYAQLRPRRQAEARITHARMHHLALLTALFADGSRGRAATDPSDPSDLPARAEKYLSTILKQRFKATSISDLSQAPTFTTDQHRGPSQLMMYIYTVSRAIDRLRAKKKWSLHDLYTRAHLECPCLACRRTRAVAQHPGESVMLESNHPF